MGIPCFANLRTSEISEIGIFIMFTKRLPGYYCLSLSLKRIQKRYEAMFLKSRIPLGLFGDTGIANLNLERIRKKLEKFYSFEAFWEHSILPICEHPK